MNKIVSIVCTAKGVYTFKKGDIMNAEQLLNQVEKAIKERAPSTARRYAVCWDGEDFHCLPMAPDPKSGTVLGTYTHKELTEGLTTKQWGTLLTKLAKAKPEETT